MKRGMRCPSNPAAKTRGSFGQFCKRIVHWESVLSVNAIYRQLLPQATIFRMSKERWAQIGITTEFFIVVRTLGEFFRLRHVHRTDFSTALAALYVGGALIAACSCWAGMTFYFFRRYMLSALITLATVPGLLLYKITEIGR
jgi:hypothetical protein